jgi:hypothetical protein
MHERLPDLKVEDLPEGKNMFNESAQKLTVYFGKEDELRSSQDVKSMDEIQHK